MQKASGTENQFYVGNIISLNKDMQKAFANLSPKDQRACQKMLQASSSAYINDLASGRSPETETLSSSVINNIYKHGNIAGLRIHYLIYKNGHDNKPVVLLVAAYHKEQQPLVLKHLVTQNSKQIKKVGGL